MDQLKEELAAMPDEKLAEVLIFIEGIRRGRAHRTNVVVQAKPPRKRSACSICHQSGHRAPNCPEKGPAA